MSTRCDVSSQKDRYICLKFPIQCCRPCRFSSVYFFVTERDRKSRLNVNRIAGCVQPCGDFDDHLIIRSEQAAFTNTRIQCSANRVFTDCVLNVQECIVGAAVTVDGTSGSGVVQAEKYAGESIRRRRGLAWRLRSGRGADRIMLDGDCPDIAYLRL